MRIELLRLVVGGGWPGGFGLLFALSAAPMTLELATFSRER